MGHIVQTMMTFTQLQKHKYEYSSTYSSELDSSSSNSSNSEDKQSTNSMDDIEEQLQHANNINSNNVTENLDMSNNKDIHSVSDNYIPAILPKRPWGEFSILHYNDTSSNIYSSLPSMIHSLDIRNNYSKPNIPPSTTNIASPSYTIPPQGSILSETDDDEDHQDYDDSNAMDDIIKMMEDTHLNLDKNVPNLCKSSSSSSSSLSSGVVESNNNDNIDNKNKNISHPSVNKSLPLLSPTPITTILNNHTRIPISSSNTFTINNDNNISTKIKKETTNPSTFLPSDFQFSFNIEKNEPKKKSEQEENPSFLVTRCASPLTLKNRKILPMPKSRIKKLNKEIVLLPSTTTAAAAATAATAATAVIKNNKMDKPNFLNKEQPYNFTTISSIKNNYNNNEKSNTNKTIYKYEDDTIHDHTKKMKRTNHYVIVSEKSNMNFNKTLNGDTNININRSSTIPTSSSPDNSKNKNKKNILSSTSTITTIYNNNHFNNNNNNNTNSNYINNNNKNNTFIPQLSFIQKKKSSKSGNNLPNIRQTLSTSTSGSTKSTNNTIPSSSTIPKNRNNHKSKKKSLPEGQRQLRQQRQQQQQKEDPFSINLISPLNTTDWVCLFCQYEIFMDGWMMTQKKKKLAQKRKTKKMKKKLEIENGHNNESEI